MVIDFAVELEIGKGFKSDFGLHPGPDSVHHRLVQRHLDFHLRKVGKIEQLLPLPHRHSFLDHRLASAPRVGVFVVIRRHHRAVRESCSTQPACECSQPIDLALEPKVFVGERGSRGSHLPAEAFSRSSAGVNLWYRSIAMSCLFTVNCICETLNFSEMICASDA